MRDPEERTRHFIVRKKKEEEIFDEPSEKRVSAQQKERVSPERKRAGEEDNENLKAGFFARYTGKGRGDDDVQAERSRARFEESFDDDEFEEEEEDESKKAPLLVRIFAWVALLAIFFVCGYLGANYFFNWADKKGGPRVGNVVGSGTEASRVVSGANISNGSGNVKYDLFIPEGKTFTEREIEIKKGMVEEDIEKVVSVYIDGLKETQMLDNSSRVLNVFRSGDWLYLDMTGAFGTSLKTLGKDKASMVITGLVRTMRDNFPPIKKVKFYIDGKESGEKAPVDLTKPWEIS